MHFEKRSFLVYNIYLTQVIHHLSWFPFYRSIQAVKLTWIGCTRTCERLPLIRRRRIEARGSERVRLVRSVLIKIYGFIVLHIYTVQRVRMGPDLTTKISLFNTVSVPVFAGPLGAVSESEAAPSFATPTIRSGF